MIAKVSEMVRLGRDGHVERYDIDNLRKGLKGALKDVWKKLYVKNIVSRTVCASYTPRSKPCHADL